jgi:hypothetical protein
MNGRLSIAVGGGTLTLLAASLAVMTGPASAATSMTARPPVVQIAVSGNQATISQTTMRPGVVEFHVGRTFTIPGSDGGPDTMSIVRTDQLDQVLALLPSVFGGDPSDSVALAAAAQSIRTIHAITTWYGGAGKGGVWQANLAPGNYYALGVESTAMGLAKPVAFTVAGEPRPGVLHSTQATVRAVGPVGNNKWTFRRASDAPIEWLRFTNAARELHFMGLGGVASTTTNAQVKNALQGPPGPPPKWFTGPDLSFDVISPGVSVAIKEDMPAGKYVVDCFMPSESDGMPHALMGMWKLFIVK